MKRIFILLSLLCFNVYADKCDSSVKKDLLKDANLIKVDYEEKEEDVHVSDEYYNYTTKSAYLVISFYNLTDDFYIKVSNDLNDDVRYLSKEDFKDGKYSFRDDNYYNIVKYKLEVYSNIECDRYLVKTIYYTKPMFNSNYGYQICQDNLDVPFCQKYITRKKNVYTMGIGLKDAVEDYKNGLYIEEEEDDDESFLEKYYIHLIVGTVVVCMIGGVVYYIYRKRSEL